MRLPVWVLLGALLASSSCMADMLAAERWIDREFKPSSLTRPQQLDELKWFIATADILKRQGIHTIRVVSEKIDTHSYESRTLSKAFEEITGIAVQHDVIAEGDLVDKLYTAMQTGVGEYDGWISDSDLIGTHYRYGAVVPISDYIEGAGREFTNPALDLKDFIGLQFTTAPDGKLYQLPDQQFANLYWFRADWFARKDLQARFRAQFGYELGVPKNWSAYEDIASFFSHSVKELDGKKVYGHMDYGKRDPSLGWRFTDAWLSMAGAADKGIPNGLPVDEWGIRVATDQCTPVGASVSRGGAVNSPPAVFALTKYVEWMKQFAPPEALNMTFFRCRAGSRARSDCTANFLVHRLHGCSDTTRQSRGEQGRHPEVENGAIPPRAVLENRNAKRLPGRWGMDLSEVNTTPEDVCRVAVRTVRDLQDGVPAQVCCGTYLHSRVRYQTSLFDKECRPLRRAY
jgi:glycerol transport system substrate-binding protein